MLKFLFSVVRIVMRSWMLIAVCEELANGSRIFRVVRMMDCRLQMFGRDSRPKFHHVDGS